MRIFEKVMAAINVKIEKAAVELAEARRKFSEAESKYEALLQQYAREMNANPASPKPTIDNNSDKEERSITSDASDNGIDATLSYKIVTLIKTDRNKRWRLREVHSGIPNAKLQNLRQTLYRLVNSGKVKKAGYGKFKAPPESTN